MKILIQALLLVTTLGLITTSASADPESAIKAVDLVGKAVFLGEDGKFKPIDLAGRKGDSSENPCCTNSEGTPCLGQCKGCRKWCSDSVMSGKEIDDKLTAELK